MSAISEERIVLLGRVRLPGDLVLNLLGRREKRFHQMLHQAHSLCAAIRQRYLKEAADQREIEIAMQHAEMRIVFSAKS